MTFFLDKFMLEGSGRIEGWKILGRYGEIIHTEGWRISTEGNGR